MRSPGRPHIQGPSLAVALAVLVACAPQNQAVDEPTPALSAAAQTVAASPSPTLSPGVSPTGTPAPAPTATGGTETQPPESELAVAPPEDLIPPGAVVEVAVDSVRVRDEPGLDADVVDTVSAGELVYVDTGHPVEVDGLIWMYVGRADEPFPHLASAPLGWVAEGDGEQLYFRVTDVTCPAGSPDIETFASLTPWARLACFGSSQLTLTGYDHPENYGYGGECGCSAEPPWLIHPFTFGVVSPSVDQRDPQLFIRFAPGVEMQWPAEPGQRVELVGHSDDPASEGCTMSNYNEDGSTMVPITEREQQHLEFTCREQFVVTSVTVLGAP